MTYNGYTAIVQYDDRDRLFHGHLLGTTDQVYFEGQTVDALETAFREAVDDYLAYCAETGRTPAKPASGRLNVRMGPDLHRRAQIEAARRGVSLNTLIAEALEKMVP